MANNYKRWLCEETLKTPLLATHFNIFWIQKQTFTHYCRLHGPSLARKIICDKILVSHTLRWYEFLFLYFSFFLFCFCFSLLFYFIINVYKNYFINFFFHVPWCSGMFRHVRPECSVFRVLSTPNAEVFPASRSLSPPEWIYRGYYMAARGYTNFIFEWEILSAWDTFAKCLSQKCYETRI